MSEQKETRQWWCKFQAQQLTTVFEEDDAEDQREDTEMKEVGRKAASHQ